MAITGPSDLPVILKLRTESIKKYALTQLGYPSVDVEITEDQLEAALRVTCDFVARYFPHEQRLAAFYTEPLRTTYPLPNDAYWIQEVSWDPATTYLANVFGAESYLFNIGSLTGPGVHQLLTDYHLLQSYRRFSQQILGTIGNWEVLNEVDGGPSEQLIRLIPTPKGVFPVLVLYMPEIRHFRSPTAKMLASEMLTAECKCIVGAVRRKIAGIPLPDGGSLTLDGDALVSEGREEKDKILKKAIALGEPLGIYKH